jgi:hypothetical protein
MLRSEQFKRGILTYQGRPYHHYKSIPCMFNLAVQIRTLERRAPPGTFHYQRGGKTSLLGEEYEFLAGTTVWCLAKQFVDDEGM